MAPALPLITSQVIDLFRQLDEDGDGAVSRLEFRRVLPLMGYDASDTEAIDDLFDDLDLDGSGAIAYEELKELLTVDRLAERGIELAAVLQDGALGEIEVTAKNKNSLRGGDVTIRRGEGREASIAALQTQLWSTAGKVRRDGSVAAPQTLIRDPYASSRSPPLKSLFETLTPHLAASPSAHPRRTGRTPPCPPTHTTIHIHR